jgi:LuxR family maltose regulon positive regulatory protein
MAQYVLARLFLVLGRREKVPGALEKAWQILNGVLPESEARGAYALLLEGLVLMAQVEGSLGRPQQAQDCLHRALDLGAPERPVRVFLDEGEPLMSLLGERCSLDLPPAERAYLEALWSAWSEEQGLRAGVSPVPEEPWIEPLSRREVEVLRALAEGKSNQEIAARLVLSLNTVKKHVSTIMGKLNAKNRTQAVLLARRLGLLE